MVLREIHCAELELAGSPPWRRHSSVFQQGEPVTWRAIWNWGWGRKKWDVSLLFCFCWGCFFCPQPSCLDFSDDTPTSVILYSVIFHQHRVTVGKTRICTFIHVSTWCTEQPSLQYCLFKASLSPHSTAFVLHSIIPLLQSGVEKRESGNFIIITSHFCNLYAMRTLCACSYNQVCRNRVRCFTNSWGDVSSNGGYGFSCC